MWRSILGRMGPKRELRFAAGHDRDPAGPDAKLEALIGSDQLQDPIPLVLRDWTAQDFADLYVRYRPHLIDHAGKFLFDSGHAEEVVQDAFLYLMTALPSIDSEVGVLRFLKWKTRLLCLDLIRSQGKHHPMGADVLDEDLPSEELEVSERISRADDAAIVRLALAKLNQRQREALIATVYEEKSYEEASQQMGLSQNAFGQLLYRSKKAFKLALVGEASQLDLTVSEALSVAARRHRAGILSGASALTLIFMGWAFYAHPFDSSPQSPAYLATPSQSEAGAMLEGALKVENSDPAPETTAVPGVEPQTSNVTPSIELAPVSQQQVLSITSEEAPSGSEQFSEASYTDNGEQALASQLFLQEEVRTFGLALEPNLAKSEPLVEGSDYRWEVEPGLFLVTQTGECPENHGICSIFLNDTRRKQNLVWLSTNFAVVNSGLSSDGFAVVATDFLVGDFGGNYGNASLRVEGLATFRYLNFELEVRGSGPVLLNLELRA